MRKIPKRLIIRIIAVFIILVLILVLVIKFFPFGSKSYIVSDLQVSLPKFSSDIKKDNKDSIIFKTIRSKSITTFELDKILSKYDKYLCNNQYYYYDKNSNLTILNFNIDSNLLTSKITIKYRNGKIGNSICSRVYDSKYLKYSIEPTNETGYCYIPDKFDYTDESCNKHTVYYDCFGDLLFRNGKDKKTYIDQLIGYKWLRMNTLIDFFEKQSQNGLFQKENYDNEGSIIYKNADLYLLRCDTKVGNKDVYIGKEIDTNKEYCK